MIRKKVNKSVFNWDFVAEAFPTQVAPSTYNQCAQLIRVSLTIRFRFHLHLVENSVGNIHENLLGQENL